jgi:uncharacterized protein (DUF1697 family)
MKYVALLRGINVGGNSTVSMSILKETLSNISFRNVSTYINSGNVLFESDQKESLTLETEIEAILEKTFFPIRTVVLSEETLQHVIEKAPSMWKTDDVRKYVAFLKSPTKPSDIAKEFQPKEGLDFIDEGPGVVYLTTKMEGLTQSSFPKLITKKIYQDMTMRNFNTVEKLFSLMQKN